MKGARKYLVRGRVQGVGFRYYVQKAANRIGVRGYVRNLDDGSVEVYGVGTPDQIVELEAMLWKGPTLSEIEAVEEAEAELEEYRDFLIRH